jgi:uncharacterized OB-fold protein
LCEYRTGFLMPAAAHSKTDGANVEYFPPPKPWRLEGDRLHLVGMACAVCGTKAFPAREVCSGCGSDDVKPCELAASGNLYSFSEVHVAPKGFAVPYVVGYVDLDDGVRLFGQVEGTAATLAIDQRVTVILGPIRSRSDGTPVMSYKFKGLSA